MAKLITFTPPPATHSKKTGPCAFLLWPGATSPKEQATANAELTAITPPAPVRTRKRQENQKAEHRANMLAKIHIAISDLCKKLEHFTKDFYLEQIDQRYSLTERFGRVTSADLSANEMHQTLLWLGNLGWQAKKGRHRKEAPAALRKDYSGWGREALLKKIEAMLAEKGRAEGTDMPWGYAIGILKRQTKNEVTNLDKATPKQLRAIIAALYRDAERKDRRVN